MAVLLETTLGDLVVDLYTEERPRACLNFMKLCKIKYYNYCLIHNVQRDFIIQTGDPTGSGRGGESIFCKLYGDQARYFEAEKMPRIKHKKKGTVSMVNNGNDQHGSQFLITVGENLDYLNGVHTVFGEVTEGMDVLMKINEAFVDKDFCPYQDIRITHTVILEDPFDDPQDLEIPDRSPEPTKEQLDSGRIGADEEIDDTKGKTAEEVEEGLAEKEASTRAILLEMQEDCEKAYFKMDNVLIDDRRIHVDFSQSVAKVQWKGKGGKYTKEDFKEYEKDLGKSSGVILKDKARPKQDSKYELLLDEAEASRSHRHSKKHHKEKRHRRHSEEGGGDKRKATKHKTADMRELQLHKNVEESCRGKKRDEKRRHQCRSRSSSGSQERDYHQHSKSKKKSKYREDAEERRSRS
ncbi:peptidyl-prolyl cis-trans isomerase-like 4 isoform X2 [Narcine bancroftii]|uniref:peptidyl-prolyl cis-trans isomerase-like 4 isoform X2 n=1 Tax=Narcine bancroftii TaxID=1343680 RepID=UPI003831469E